MADREERQPAKPDIDPKARYRAERAASHEFHKQHDSLGIHYHFYPEDRPKRSLTFNEHDLGDRDR